MWRGIGAHQPLGAAMADAHFGETIEVAREVFPFRNEAASASRGRGRAEDMAADGGVGGMEDRPGAHDRLSGIMHRADGSGGCFGIFG